MKDLIVFDLDGTLAKSKSAIDDEMATLLARLLAVVRVAIISGGDLPQFQTQVIDRLPSDAALNKLSLLPTSGTKFFTYDGQWRKLYSEDLSDAEKHTIEGALEGAVAQTGFQPAQTWGERIEDRGTQVTYSALGQQAPLEAKETWDPDFAKRKAIAAILATTLPNFSVRLGGTTSIDVTRPGIDKAYGIYKLRDVLHIPLNRMLYVGDAIFPGGNDYAASEAGVDCVAVRDPEDAKRVIETIIALER
jgi:HAD superfamily hydrolase (TIGR01484 family)